MQNSKQWEEDSKILNAQTQRRIKCKKCGCTRTTDTINNKKVCKNCGYYIFRSDKDEFIYRMKERLIYDKRKGNSEDNTKEKSSC